MVENAWEQCKVSQTLSSTHNNTASGTMKEKASPTNTVREGEAQQQSSPNKTFWEHKGYQKHMYTRGC